MGEYAIRKSDNEEIKIGTCESMYYLRYEDRNKVKKIDSSVDPANELNLFWRLPFEDEDSLRPGEYGNHDRGYRLYKTDDKERTVDFTDSETIKDPGIVQYHNESGLMLNVNCYHGERLPQRSEEIKPFWNGRSWFYELKHIKNCENEIRLVVACRFCRNMWSHEYDDLKDYLHEEMKSRIKQYCNS